MKSIFFTFKSLMVSLLGLKVTSTQSNTVVTDVFQTNKTFSQPHVHACAHTDTQTDTHTHRNYQRNARTHLNTHKLTKYTRFLECVTPHLAQCNTVFAEL